jgi:DNA polymerase-1
MTTHKKKGRIFMPDGPWYLHRAFNTLHTKRSVEEALPYHFLSMVCKDMLRTKSQYLLIAFDGPRVFRYKVYANYKGERDKKRAGSAPVDPDSGLAQGNVYDYLPNVYELLNKAGIIYFQPRTFEADDVGCSIAHAYSAEYDIVIGTQDKDAYQYLKPGVRLFDASHKNKKGETDPIYIDHKEAEKRKGIPIKQMVQYQMLIGDKIDSIPQIQGFGPVKAREILERYGSLTKWYKQSEADRPFLESQMENLRRNRKLVTLSTEAVPPTPVEDWKIAKAKPKDKDLPKNFHDMHAMIWPKSKGLFG